MILKGKLPYILLLRFYSFRQLFYAQALEYPKGYFTSTLPRDRGYFGEPSPLSYGTGLRTAQKQNLPVYAVADGYISRIKIEPWDLAGPFTSIIPTGIPAQART